MCACACACACARAHVSVCVCVHFSVMHYCPGLCVRLFFEASSSELLVPFRKTAPPCSAQYDDSMRARLHFSKLGSKTNTGRGISELRHFRRLPLLTLGPLGREDQGVPGFHRDALSHLQNQLVGHAIPEQMPQPSGIIKHISA